MTSAGEFTKLLHAVDEGRAGAVDDLMELAYEDLRGVAERHLAARFGRSLPGVTLEPAALVNESFMTLMRQRNAWVNRSQFFAIATRIMVRVLLDYERRRHAARRGGGAQRVTLSLNEPHAQDNPGPEAPIGIAPLASALERLDELDPRKADVVKLRVIWGLRMPEVAEALGCSLATVERDWSFAKAWLAREAGRE